MGITNGDRVTIEYTGRLEDGTVFDTSRESVGTEAGLADDQSNREYNPLTVEIGSGKIITGLEDALLGMETGETDVVTIAPENGYGEHTEDRVVEYDRDEFQTMIGDNELVEGLRVQTEQGLPGDVVDVDSETVRVDFNHDLAGETLEFEIEVVSVE